jgi:predicted membrane-bound spermidine synthase
VTETPPNPMGRIARNGRLPGEPLLLGVFFASGASALIYQVAWQRLLFGTFGVDVESITIIVSTFMLGLGCGALLGGWVADRSQGHLVRLFAICEIGIGLFGLASPTIIPAIGYAFSMSGTATVAIANFVLLAFPTALMGATLPILVAHLFSNNANVGVSIGSLYLSNTFGAALGSIGAGLLFFNFLDLHQTIYLASLGNFLVATIVLVADRRGVFQ